MIYTLRRPIVGKAQDGSEVELLTELMLRRPNASDAKAIEKLSGATATLTVLQRLSGVARELLERLDVEDFYVLDEVVTGFFDSAAAVQRADAWLKSQNLPGHPSLRPTSAPSGAPSP